MKVLFYAVIAVLLVSCTSTQKAETNANVVPPTLKTFKKFESEHVIPRNVDVWLPEGYSENDPEGYAVIYVQDGQNLFNPEFSFNGGIWGLDTVMDKLISEGKIRQAIIVGIWNTPLRYEEYMPLDAFEMCSDAAKAEWDKVFKPVVSDKYLQFMVEELKPFIDKEFNTRTKADDTYIMGSSMGGLIAWYAVAKYPEVFGGAACISTHWPVSYRIGDFEGDDFAEQLIAATKRLLPQPGKHKLYFDHGTEALDAQYAPYQSKVDGIMRELGYTAGKDWISKQYDGAVHNEEAWHERVHIPLEFLLGKK